MNRSDHVIRITPSVLDRLIDEEPGLGSGNWVNSKTCGVSGTLASRC
jgi:hypothetical protein